jgi:MFS family permease
MKRGSLFARLAAAVVLLVTPSPSRKHLAAVFVSNGCAAIAYSILSPTLVANLTAWHTSSFLIGVITSIWALPNVFGGPLYTRLIARFAPQTSLVVGVLCATAAIAMFPVFPNVWAWIALQIISGAVIGHFFLVTEAWLNHFSKEASRARITAIYGMLPALGYVCGVGIYTIVGYQGLLPFVVVASAMGIALLPLILLGGAEGHAVGGGERRVWIVARMIPRLLVVGFVAGTLETVPWGIYQIYALNLGFAPRVASWILPAFYVGQILLTYPIGWLADHVGRRHMLAGVGLVAIALMGAMFLSGPSPAVWGIAFLTGGVFNAVYTIGLALLGQRFDSKTLVSAGTAYMTAYSLGAVVGPPLVGALMDWAGPRALPLILGAVAGIVVLVASVARSEWTSRHAAPGRA